MAQLRNFEAAVFRRIRREPPKGFVHRTAFWLFIAYFALALLGWIPGPTGVGFRQLAALDFFILILFCIPLLWRYIFGYLLWKVRNRLIVTYVLMGLTPVVLLCTLALLLLYVFSGQFAIFAATSVITEELAHIGTQNGNFTMHLAHVLDRDPKLQSVMLPEVSSVPREREYTGLAVAAWHDGRRIHIVPASIDAQEPPPVPSWLPERWHGVALDRGQLWLRTADRETIDGHTTVAITSVPIRKDNVEAIAQGLGIVGIYSSTDRSQRTPKPGVTIDASTSATNSHLSLNGQNPEQLQRNTISGGSLPDKQHFYDIPVRFAAPLEVTDWATGKGQQDIAATWVTSRPSLLYRRLFITALQLGDFIRDALIAIAIAFGIVELLAFLAAVRLNQTITRSVHDLYEATLAIDGGNLGHRIQVRRKDQLGALSRSFNSMTASLERLLVEQREKERLQNELAIAQEVQANLFPRGQIALPMLEIHGVCIPARTVSGDYYDFLTFGDTRLGIALGDISGKGISAALLMATLHSAVRAYCIAEVATAGAACPGGDSAQPLAKFSATQEIECGELFEEPARVLTLLNRHLYRSTQPEKYATLFLAHYDGITRRLVYSNGGHLAPLLLRANDTVTRLDRGGSVVGLIDGLEWEQGAEHLRSGDILIAYSDGVTEPENDFGEFGEHRLLEIVRRHRHLSLEAISEQVIHTLRSWIGAQEQPDDITLVLARQR